MGTWDDHYIKDINVEPPCCTPEMNIVSCLNCISIKKQNRTLALGPQHGQKVQHPAEAQGGGWGQRPPTRRTAEAEASIRDHSRSGSNGDSVTQAALEVRACSEEEEGSQHEKVTNEGRVGRDQPTRRDGTKAI